MGVGSRCQLERDSMLVESPLELGDRETNLGTSIIV
jgi:hypothetical protein